MFRVIDFAKSVKVIRNGTIRKLEHSFLIRLPCLPYAYLVRPCLEVNPHDKA